MLRMTVSLLRSISCIIVNNNKKTKERMRENKSETKDKLWKTFSEAVEDEQEFLRKYFASQEQIKMTSVSTREGVIKEGKGKKKTVMSRSDSLNIIDIYDRAMAKLPKIATNKKQNLISTEKKEENDGWKVARCCEVPAPVQVHKEIYYNSEFEDQPQSDNHQSSHLPSIYNRPLPPIPQ